MNNKTNVWAVKVNDFSASETVQRMAFTFGYGWSTLSGQHRQNVQSLLASFLLFNPENKTITYALNKNLLEEKVCKVCLTYDQVLETFKNPPKVKKVEEVGNVKVYDDGSLLVSDTYTIDDKDVDKIVEVRNKLMGKKQKLPVIKFRYHSPTSGSKVRQIALVSEDNVYLSGLDLEDRNNFKQFRKDRLEVGGAIWFCGLTEA